MVREGARLASGSRGRDRVGERDVEKAQDSGVGVLDGMQRQRERRCCTKARHDAVLERERRVAPRSRPPVADGRTPKR